MTSEKPNSKNTENTGNSEPRIFGRIPSCLHGPVLKFIIRKQLDQEVLRMQLKESNGFFKQMQDELTQKISIVRRILLPTKAKALEKASIIKSKTEQRISACEKLISDASKNSQTLEGKPGKNFDTLRLQLLQSQLVKLEAELLRNQEKVNTIETDIFNTRVDRTKAMANTSLPGTLNVLARMEEKVSAKEAAAKERPNMHSAESQVNEGFFDKAERKVLAHETLAKNSLDSMGDYPKLETESMTKKEIERVLARYKLANHELNKGREHISRTEKSILEKIETWKEREKNSADKSNEELANACRERIVQLVENLAEIKSNDLNIQNRIAAIEQESQRLTKQLEAIEKRKAE